MVELISRVSKGTRMDQIYIPKERMPGFEIGKAIAIRPVLEKPIARHYHYKVKGLEPVKNTIIAEILDCFEGFDNVIITGSFLDRGFDFRDIDVILITEGKADTSSFESRLERELGIRVHVMAIDFKSLVKGLSTDPLFQTMLCKFVSKKRVIFRAKREINYKLLDMHLLESKAMIYNFSFLTGREKYKLARNLVAIKLFMENRKISVEAINSEIDRYFGRGTAKNIKENLLGRDFLNKYRELYGKIFNRILDGIRNAK